MHISPYTLHIIYNYIHTITRQLWEVLLSVVNVCNRFIISAKQCQDSVNFPLKRI